VKAKIASLAVTPDLPLFHLGPPLDLGPLPAFFYFFVSGPDTLTLDPGNQPVQFLHGKMIRVFSLTLPGHEADLPPDNAMNVWAEDIAKGNETLSSFFDSAIQAVDFAIRERFVDPEKMGIGGLSRGGFAAAHVAARDERFKFLLGFAPLTQLSLLKEFSSLRDHPLVANLGLERLAPALAKRNTRLYIGNRDMRVGTRSCFDFAMALTEAAHEQKIRSPHVECIISPSIGKEGHGTPPEIFRQGAAWMAECLERRHG